MDPLDDLKIDDKKRERTKPWAGEIIDGDAHGMMARGVRLEVEGAVEQAGVKGALTGR